MFCKNCGKPVHEGDKFCSGCGAKIETEFVPAFRQSVDYSESSESREQKPSRSFHIENFNWDLDGYPTDSKKTEDIDFNWDSVLEEKQKNLFAKKEIKWDQVQEEEPQSFSQVNSQEVWEPAEEKAEDFRSLEEALFADMGSLNAEEPTRVASKEELKSEKIDKFYTFNKKNAELQALLDQEYERLQRDHGDEDFGFSQQSSPARHEEFDWTLPDAKDFAVPAFAAEEEPAEEIAKEVAVETEEQCVAVVWAQPPLGYTVELPQPEIAKEPEPAAEEKGESTAPKFPPSCEEKQPEEAKEEQQPRLTFDDVFGADDDDFDEKPKKKGTFLKTVAIILCILVVLELIMIGIQYFAPDSAAGKAINKGYESVLNLFTGGENDDPEPAAEPEGEPSEVSLLIAEKLALNENIAAVSENQDLTFEAGENYGFQDFSNTYTFVDKPWYEGDDGVSVTYGGEIIGTVIQYYSSWLDKINGKNEKVLDFIDDTSEFYTEISDLEGEKDLQFGINRLEIGEIRAGGSGFYVLTSVALVDSDTNSEVTEKQILYLEPVSKTMKIVELKVV